MQKCKSTFPDAKQKRIRYGLYYKELWGGHSSKSIVFFQNCLLCWPWRLIFAIGGILWKDRWRSSEVLQCCRQEYIMEFVEWLIAKGLLLRQFSASWYIFYLKYQMVLKWSGLCNWCQFQFINLMKFLL